MEEKKVTFESIMQGFEEMRERWLSKADKVLETYRGCDPRELFLAEREMEEIALDAAKWIEEASRGCYPKESLSILADVMKQLVLKKDQMRKATGDQGEPKVIDWTHIELRDDFASTAN